MTYGRVGKGLITDSQGWDGSIRVDFQEIRTEVLSLSISSTS
jgi:hypothetical protein